MLRLISLIKALASPYDEIVGEWWLADQVIDSLQLTDDGFVMCVWSGSLEYQIDSDHLTDDGIQELIKQLEEEFYD